MKCSQPRSVNHHRRWVSFGIAFMVLATSAVAFGHAAVLWAYVVNNHVYVEAFFMGGAKVKNGRFRVLVIGTKKTQRSDLDYIRKIPQGEIIS